MKTMNFFMFATLLVMTVSARAQVSVNVNIGKPPVWAPAAPVEVEYYYLPDIQVYYDVPARRYIYFGNGRWCRSASLPSRYRGYDLYHGQTVYLNDYHGRTPYTFYREHKEKYRGNDNWKANGNHENRFENEDHGNKHEHESHGSGKGHGKR
jgi:hypothetical protein